MLLREIPKIDLDLSNLLEIMSSDLVGGGSGYDYNVPYTKSVLVEGSVDQTPQEGQVCSVEVKALFDPAHLETAMTTGALKMKRSSEQLIGFKIGKHEAEMVKFKVGSFTTVINSVLHKAVLQMKLGELAHLSFEIEAYKLDETLQWIGGGADRNEVTLDIKFQLTLVEIEGDELKPLNVYKLTNKRLYDLCVEHKKDANQLFQAGCLATAFQRYRKSMSFVIIIEHQRTLKRADNEFEGKETPEEDTEETNRLLQEVKVIKSQLFGNLAACQLKSKNYDMVVVNCTKCLDLDKANVKALFRRGQAHLGRNDFEEAIADFNAALELDQNNKEILQKLQLAEQSRKKYEQAMSANYRKIFS